ncbi:MAG: discoidin domain-containing protein [[Ruminococcus] torques]
MDLYCRESEEIQGLINTYKTQLAAGNVEEATTTQLVAEMTTIIEACDGFHAKSKNEAMKAEILPFTNSLKDLCTAIRSFAQAQDAMQKNDMQSAFDLYMAGSGSYATSQTYTKEMYNASPAVVTPGSTHLIPLAKTLEAALSDPMNDYVAGDVERPLKITAEASFQTWQSGKPADIIDGNSGTYAWYNGAEGVGQYYQVNFSKPTTIYGVHIENGAGKEKPDDTFGYAKLKYQAEGSDEWKELENGKEYGPYAAKVDVAGLEIENVTAVRYECSRVGGSGKWPSMREFKVDLQPGAADTFTKEVIRTTEGWTVYNNGNENNAIDGDEGTSVHYNVRQGDPTNGDSMIAGDYFGVKLSEKITLGKIKIVQGNNDTHADYMQNCDLEWSVDGQKWTKIATFENKRTIEIDVSDKDIQAQYVRIKNNATQKNWFAIREFDVDSKVWFNSKVYTNVDAYKEYRANLLDESAEIEAKNDITLKKDQYIGLKLDRIHEIKDIQKNLENADKLTLETSLNAYEWTTYDAKKPGDARYIRLINKTNDDVKFNLKQFVVNTVEFKEKSLHSKSGNYTITDPEKAFDGNRATEAVYQTSQNEGVWFVYDLGQTIHFDKFKAVCEDSEHDYIRHGKFSVSTDGETWEEIMTLGSQDGPNNGEANDTDEIGAVLPNHETSYNTKEATNINKDARYLKFEVTRTKVGSDKWVRFSELEINDGAYVPSENDPTYESSCLDTQNGKFSYMSDMNLATSFVPAEKSGNLVYHVSEKNDRNKIKIVQRADSISNATVSVRTLAEADTWKPVGTLGKTVNEFVLPNETVLLDVKIEWSDAKVGIIEMFLSKTDAPTPEEKVWTVTLDGKEVKVKDGEKLTKPADPTKEGYKFLGWFVGDKEFNFDTPITEELNGIKIEARFEKIDEPTPEEKFWTVTLDGNEVKVKDGEKLTKPADPTKEGYKFLGWFVGDKEFNFDTPITEELNGIKIEARFEKIDTPTPGEKEWTVTLNGKEVKVKDGEKLTKPADPTKEGYKFLGWFVGDKKFDFDTPITKELNGIKIEARFEKIKDEPQQPNKGGAVQTGDTTNIALWIACLGIAGAAVAVTLRSRRKRS